MDQNRGGAKKYNWWKKRTKVEKILFVLVGLGVIVIVYLISNLWMTHRLPSHAALQHGVCMTEKCIKASAKILEKIDKKADPCTDFFKFACGKFIKNAIIPADKVATNNFIDISNKDVFKFMKIYEEPVKEGDLHSIQLVKAIYKSCMNTTQIKKEGLPFVKQLFKDLGGWPVLEHNYWVEKTFDWKNTLYQLQRLGWRKSMLINLYVATDSKNSSKNILTITQPCLSIERLKKGLNDTTVQAMFKYYVDLAMLFGANQQSASSEMLEVLEFEIGLAHIMVPYEKRKNTSLEYNPITIRALKRQFPSFPWLQYINSYLAPIDMLQLDDIVNLALPKFFEKFLSFLENVKQRTLANYMFLKLASGSIYFLPGEFNKIYLEYIKKAFGIEELTPRWKACVSYAGRLNIAASAIYARNFFNIEVKNTVLDLTMDIKGSFLETLQKASWMDKKTKKHALLKAEKMNTFIGYPDELFDDEKVEDIYKQLRLDSDVYVLKLDFNLTHFRHLSNTKELRRPVIRNDWRSQSYIHYANAWYANSLNTIEIPAAILQDTVYDPELPQYMNYGAIGEVIGHEITHGFDDRGRQYDQDGNVVDWWEPETNKTFSKKSQCLVDQYSNYTIPDIEMSVNGVRTLSENIADNGGIKIAYRGYERWLERNREEMGLPGLPFTGRQMFWISAATNWCTKYKKEFLKQMVTTGVHAPNYFRVVVPFMNSDNFGKDFNCPVGSPMNPKYKCRVW